MSASPKQAEYVKKLQAERIVPDAINVIIAKALADPKMTPGAFAKLGVIGILQALPRCKPAPEVPQLAPGLYVLADAVYEVHVSQAQKLYAKVLSRGGKFEFKPGAIYDLPADATPVTIEQALAFGLKHGMCVKGHPLKKPLSIALGIGPDCCVSLFGMSQAQLAAERGIKLAA